MIIDERISMSLADKVEVWLDFLQEQSNDEEGIEYTRLVLEYGCSLVDYNHEIRKHNESNVDIEGAGSSYDIIDRVGYIIDYVEALGNGELNRWYSFEQHSAGEIDYKGVRNIYIMGNGWYEYDYSKVIKNKYTHFGWRYGTHIY